VFEINIMYLDFHILNNKYKNVYLININVSANLQYYDNQIFYLRGYQQDYQQDY
jgi:hypothetical protein